MSIFFIRFLTFFLCLGTITGGPLMAESERTAASLPPNFESLSYAAKIQQLDSLSDSNVYSPFDQLFFRYTQLKLAEAEKDSAEIVEDHFSLAFVYSEVGLYNESLESSILGKEIAALREDWPQVVKGYFRMAASYLGMKDIESAWREANNSIELAEQIQDTVMMAWSYNMAGEILRLTDRVDSAEQVYQKALYLFLEVDMLTGANIVYHNLGLVHAQREEDSLALAAFERVSDYDDVAIIATLEKGIAMMDILYRREGIERVRTYGDSLIQAIRDLSMDNWEVQVAEKMAEIYLRNGQPNVAIRYFQFADSVEDQLSLQQSRFQVQLLEQRRTLEQVTSQNALLQQQNRNQRTRFISALVILGLMVVIGVLLWRNNRRSRSTVRELAHRNSQLDEMVAEKDIWINLMAHDLKAPLHAITGLLALARAPETPPEFRDQAIDRIERSVRNGSEMIAQLLELARIEGNQVVVRQESVALSPLIRAVREAFQAAADQKSILFHLDLPEKDSSPATDPELVRRILDNFVSNALKFSPPDRSVTLALHPEADRVGISVRDRGPGIRPEEQAQLFQKFQRLSARPTGGESSTGLGLSIVKALADKLGAAIDVASTWGEGTTFTLWLPLSPSGA